MTDHTITALTSTLTGVAVYAQTQAMPFSMAETAGTTAIGMIATALVTYGILKKASERHEAEIGLLRLGLNEINNTLSDVRERVARIEGKLDNEHTG